MLWHGLSSLNWVHPKWKLLSHSTSCDTIQMNACTHLRASHENTTPTWLCPLHLHHKTMLIPQYTQARHPNHHHNPPWRKLHTMPPETTTYNSLNLPCVNIMTPPPQPNLTQQQQKNQIKNQIPNNNRHPRIGRMVCHTHYPHIRHPMEHPHKQ